MDSGNILQMTPLRKIGSERCLTYAAESSSITFKRVGFFSCNYLRLKHSSVLTLNLFIVDPPPTPATHKKNSLIITQTHTTTFSFHVGNLVLQCLFTCSAFLFVILYYIRCLFAFFLPFYSNETFCNIRSCMGEVHLFMLFYLEQVSPANFSTWVWGML